MKNRGDIDAYILIKIGIVIFICILLALANYSHNSVKELGGDMTIELEAGQKLEEITWKDDSLWYLTRPMRDDETAETHVFQQDRSLGVMEGTVTIIEKNKKK